MSNKKGFILTESLIVSCVVLTTLVLIYSQFAKINKNYFDSYSYNDANDSYVLKNISQLITNDYYQFMNSYYSRVSSENYIDLTDVAKLESTDTQPYVYTINFDYIKKVNKIKTLLLTFQKKNNIITSLSLNNSYSIKLQNYIKTIDDSYDQYDYRLIAEFEDGTFSTIPFGSSIYYDNSLSIDSVPKYYDGLIPIQFSNTNTKVYKADITSEWYNYAKKEWANAVVVKADKRDYYLSSQAGTEILESDILGYFVWLPSMRFKVPESESPQEIKLYDVNDVAGKKLPGFTFGYKQYGGFWMGKFETTGTSDTPTILPNQRALCSMNIRQQFDTSLLFNKYDVYGINMNAHMVKSSEWAVAAYYSNSKFGRCDAGGECTEIAFNNDQNLMTGSSEITAGVTTPVADVSYAYGTNNDYSSSTTNNITGIFDMSGGADEYVMGTLVNTDTNMPLDPTNLFSTFPDDKYYDKYTTNNADTACNGSACIGHALSDTAGWYDDAHGFVSSSSPWLVRGSILFQPYTAGIFSVLSRSGNADEYTSFRVVLFPD